MNSLSRDPAYCFDEFGKEDHGKACGKDSAPYRQRKRLCIEKCSAPLRNDNLQSESQGKNTEHQMIFAQIQENAGIGKFTAVERVSIHASSREDATVSVESNINQNVTFAKARRK